MRIPAEQLKAVKLHAIELDCLLQELTLASLDLVLTSRIDPRK